MLVEVSLVIFLSPIDVTNHKGTSIQDRELRTWGRRKFQFST